MVRRLVPKKQRQKSGKSREEVAKEIWQKGRQNKLRRGWITVTKTGRVVIVQPHMHEYPHGRKPKEPAQRPTPREEPRKQVERSYEQHQKTMCMLKH